MDVCENTIEGLDSLVFHTREDFYNYIKQFEGFTIPEPQIQKQQEEKFTHPLFPDSLLHEMYERGKMIMDSVHNARVQELFPLSLTITKIPANPPISELYNATVTGGVPPYNYQWSSGMTFPIIIDPNEPPPADKGGSKLCVLPKIYVTTNQMPTQYLNATCGLTLTVTDANGCLIKGSPSAKEENSPENYEETMCIFAA